MTDMPLRPAFWNVPTWAEIAVYVVGISALLICIAGVVRCVQLWKQGAPKTLEKSPKERLSGLWRDAFMHRRLLKSPGGLIHFVIFWGFVFLFFGTATATIDWDIAHYLFDARILKGNVYLVYKLILDIAGLLSLIAIIVAALRRW